MSDQKLIYICSPLRGDIQNNIARAREYCKIVITTGHIPISTHVMFDRMLDDNNPHERALALQCGLALVKKCDEVWVFGEIISEGMAGEIAEAAEYLVPVIEFERVDIDG